LSNIIERVMDRAAWLPSVVSIQLDYTREVVVETVAHQLIDTVQLLGATALASGAVGLRFASAPTE
jgi:hypothetical protein